MEMNALTLVYAGLILLALIILLSSIKVVPQRKAYIVERLGKYRVTLMAGFNIIMPFIDRVRYRHTLKEQAIDVASQICITRDNISVEVDGILYLQVIDPMKASYGIDHYQFASIQIAQTTMRSIIGKLELDRTFEERETINNSIVSAVDKASDPWGVKVNRYEVKNIIPPSNIRYIDFINTEKSPSWMWDILTRPGPKSMVYCNMAKKAIANPPEPNEPKNNRGEKLFSSTV